MNFGPNCNNDEDDPKYLTPKDLEELGLAMVYKYFGPKIVRAELLVPLSILGGKKRTTIKPNGPTEPSLFFQFRFSRVVRAPMFTRLTLAPSIRIFIFSIPYYNNKTASFFGFAL